MSIFNPNLQKAYWQREQQAWEAIQDIPKIPLLGQDFSGAKYLVLPPDEAIKDIINDAQILVIIGAYYGDEGKGKWGNAFVPYLDAVARANSGSNTGRTGMHKGEKLSLHGIPSAIIEERNIPIFVGPETGNDPISLIDEEIELLVERGINYGHLGFGNFHLTLPSHRIMDVLGSASNSSTGVGIKETHASMARKTAPRLDHIFNSQKVLERKIKEDMLFYNGFLMAKDLTPKNVVQRLEQTKELNSRVVPNHVLQFAQTHESKGLENAIHELGSLYKDQITNNQKFPQRVNVPYELRSMLKSGKRIMLEGTQAYFLSNNVEQGHFEGTSSQTMASGIIAAAGVNDRKYKSKVIPIAKLPATRVGRGNIPSSFTDQVRFSEESISTIKDFGDACIDFEGIVATYFKAIGDNGIVKPVIYEDSTGQYEIGEAMGITCSRKFDEAGATTKKPRITGNLDLVLENQVVEAESEILLISAVDRLDEMQNNGITVGHVVYLPENADLMRDKKGPYIDCNGTTYRTDHIIQVGDPVPNSNVLHYCKPIVRVMKGLKNNPLRDANLKPGDYLGEELSETISLIESSGAVVKAFGNGPETEDAIYIKRIE